MVMFRFYCKNGGDSGRGVLASDMGSTLQLIIVIMIIIVKVVEKG